jgi:integrase
VKLDNKLDNKHFPTTKHSKAYWLPRVFRPVIRGKEVDNYAVRMSYGNLQRSLSTGTPNRDLAAQIARDWFVYLSAHGWATFDAKYRSPDPRAPTGPTQRSIKTTGVSVGDFLAVVRAESDLAHKTFDGYARCLRFIVSEIRAVTKQRNRYDYRKGGHKAWLRLIDEMLLEELTPDKIRAWKRLYIARAGHDELARRRYTVSCNSYLRQARALFSKRKVLDKVRSVKLPATLPFDGVELEPRTDTKFYGAGADPFALLRAAVDELALDHVEELKAFLLAITLGLRRREIDLLEWQSFDFVAGTLRIMPTKWYQLKTNESASELPVELEILKLFRGWRARASAEFVLESNRSPKSVSYQRYRCQETFQFLLGWLRSKGVQGNKPLHALRKLYGSALADLHGLHAASSGLRHADIRTTSAFYADRRVRVTPGFGSVISGGEVLAFSSSPEDTLPPRPVLPADERTAGDTLR